MVEHNKWNMLQLTCRCTKSALINYICIALWNVHNKAATFITGVKTRLASLCLSVTYSFSWATVSVNWNYAKQNHKLKLNWIKVNNKLFKSVFIDILFSDWFRDSSMPLPYFLIGCIQEVELHPLGTTGLDPVGVKLLTEIGHKLSQYHQYCHLKPLKVTPQNSTESTPSRKSFISQPTKTLKDGYIDIIHNWYFFEVHFKPVQ